MDTKKVNHQHVRYAENQPLRDLFRAVKGGTSAIRKESQFLPKFMGEEEVDYTERRSMATIDGIVMDGVAGFCGKVFHEPIDLSGVTLDAKITDNFDLQGNNLEIFTRRAFDSAFDGHAVILVDTPQANTPVKSLEDEQRQGIRPYARLYEAKDVINWRYAVDPVTKQTILTLLVLQECTDEPDGPFGVKSVTRYRVYRNDSGVTVEVWRKVEKQVSGEEFILEQEPKLLSVTAIPVGIIGELDEKPWLLNESQMEVKAYQKESAFDMIEYMSVPIFATIGYPEDAPSLKMGPKTHLRLPDSINGKADAKFVQIDSAGHTSLKATIDSIKQEIAGKLDVISTEVMPVANDQTATEVVSDDSKSQAKLMVWARQLEDALNLVLQFMGEFRGQKDGGVIALRPAWVVMKEKAQQAAKMRAQQEEANIAATAAKANG